MWEGGVRDLLESLVSINPNFSSKILVSLTETCSFANMNIICVFLKEFFP